MAQKPQSKSSTARCLQQSSRPVAKEGAAKTKLPQQSKIGVETPKSKTSFAGVVRKLNTKPSAEKQLQQQQQYRQASSAILLAQAHQREKQRQLMHQIQLQQQQQQQPIKKSVQMIPVVAKQEQPTDTDLSLTKNKPADSNVQAAAPTLKRKLVVARPTRKLTPIKSNKSYFDKYLKAAFDLSTPDGVRKLEAHFFPDGKELQQQSSNIMKNTKLETSSKVLLPSQKSKPQQQSNVDLPLDHNEGVEELIRQSKFFAHPHLREM